MRPLLIILTGFGLALADEAGSPSRAGRTASTAGAPTSGSRTAVTAQKSGKDSPGNKSTGVAQKPADDVREVLVLLDHGPLHLRLRMTLAGVSLAAVREAYVDRLMKSLDTDGDGKLSPEEAAASPIRPTRGRGRGAAFVKTLDNARGPRVVSRKEIVQDVERVGGEPVIYRQDSTSSTNDLEVFKFFDTDKSGYLDNAEMAAAATRILERDQDQDECISFQEFLPVPDPDEMAQAVVVQRTAASDRPRVTSADLLCDISQPSLAKRLLEKYDKNKDRKLSAEELGWAPERVKLLDRNSDDKLNDKELAGISATPVDLELAIDLAGAPEGEQSLVIVATAGNRLDDAKRPDLMRLAFPNAVLTLSFRKIDPIKTAIDKAMQAFNRIDIDGNGYLDAQETALLPRFQLELFEALDADGDGKIFGEEMEKYVKVQAEPKATTAWVNLYDTGRGFFESLDTNGDGRISMREMNSAGKSLKSMARKSGEKLSADDPARNFHIEFVRGSYAMFGPADQMITQSAPSFEQREAIGPIWFRRMDRNNDGDLTWNEFLGPRDVFHRIDKDGDGLIDPQEASAVRDE
jgi:Ca2+-binding EF-hand superfamily protein